MKNRIIHGFWIALTLTLLLGACKKDELMRFEAEPDIYFLDMTSNSSTNWQRYVKFNFMSVDSTLVRINVRATGKLVDYDRPVKVVAIPLPESDTINREANPEIHYEIMDSLSFIPARESYGYVTVKVRRAVSTEDKKEVKLTLKLIDNEHFNTSFDSIINNSTERKKRSMLEYSVYVSDALSKPPMWNQPFAINHLGTYSDLKYLLLCSDVISGYPPAYWEGIAQVNGKYMTPGDVPPMAERMRHYLYGRFSGSIPGGPVLEADYTMMEVPGWRNLMD